MTHNRAEASRLLRSLRAEPHPAVSTCAAANHRRSSGFVVAIEGARPYFVRFHYGGEWSWVVGRHEAEVFSSEERATAWAVRNIGGGQPKVVGVMR